MLQQIRLMNPDKEIRPDRVLFFGENNLLIFSCIFAGWIEMFLDDITCVNWLVLIELSDSEELEELMNSQEYEEYCDTLSEEGKH